MDDLELEAIARQATSELNKALSRVTQDPVAKMRIAIEASQKAKEFKELDFTFSDLLAVMEKHESSDLHIKEGAPPMVRIHGELFKIGERKLTARECRELIFSICTRRQQDLLESGREINFVYSDRGARFRVNAYLQKLTFSASIRMIKEQIPGFKELKLPPQLVNLLDHRNGLVLVTGPAGSGKSTTLAAMIDYINERKRVHIITIEDPIEYIHKDKKAIVTQREVGTDTNSFYDALKHCLRQDPNVILIGEMRDPETIQIALQAAETGHFVLSTLHTPNAVQAISRILDIFSADTQKQMKLLLASNLRGVISQRLISRTDDEGRVPAVEIMVNTPTISRLILEGNYNDIYRFIAAGQTEGMQTMNQSIHKLYREGVISFEVAMSNSDQTTELRLMIEGHSTEIMKTDDGLMSWL